jgi:hypothetical protein
LEGRQLAVLSQEADVIGDLPFLFPIGYNRAKNFRRLALQVCTETWKERERTPA